MNSYLLTSDDGKEEYEATKELTTGITSIDTKYDDSIDGLTKAIQDGYPMTPNNIIVYHHIMAASIERMKLPRKFYIKYGIPFKRQNTKTMFKYKFGQTHKKMANREFGDVYMNEPIFTLNFDANATPDDTRYYVFVERFNEYISCTMYVKGDMLVTKGRPLTIENSRLVYEALMRNILK